MLSLYSKKYRLEVVLAAVKSYEKQCEKADGGETPIHGPKSWNKEESFIKHTLVKNSWNINVSISMFST